MPLHIWLPLAHPAAPTPASAVLSGAIVKAGIIGLMLFVPFASMAGSALVVLGMVTAFAGALVGLRVHAPKAILAYSTISQMGLVIALVGAATQADGADMAPAAFYAFHHGLAKGALFLGVALVAASGGGWRRAGLVLVALVALSVAGAPFTGGGLAKMMAKGDLPPWAEFALTLSAATTTLVLGWFLYRLATSVHGTGHDNNARGERPNMLVASSTTSLALAALILPWWLWSGWSSLPNDYPLRGATIWSALWPVAIGVALIGTMAATRWPLGTRAEADPLAAAGWIARKLAPLRSVPAYLAGARFWAAEQILAFHHAGVSRMGGGAEALERSLLRWQLSGLAALAFVLVIAAISAL
jgi:formate hydrogenlyase subunit 3/multisubunit Na+/H+ antiporter MnhD subunit